MIFGALVVLLIILCLAFLIIPVLAKPSSTDSLGREQQNISIAFEKKAMLTQQLSDNEMTQEEYDAALLDLETSLALDLERQQTLESNSHDGKWAIGFIAIMVPVLSIVMYAKLGEYRVIENPELATPQQAAAAQSPHGQGENPSIEEMIEQLRTHLKTNPDDVRGWFMMGRTMMAQQNFAEAVTAYQRSYDLSRNDSPDPSIMLALADALAMTSNRRMSGEPERLVREALALRPNDPTALWLAGLASEQGGRYREAYDHWTTLLPLLSADPNSTAEVNTLIARLQAEHPDLPQTTAVAITSQGVKVAIAMETALMTQVAEDDLVFIYAKAASGPPMPLAAKRLKVSDLPVEVTLSDADAMMPQMKMSNFDDIIIGARVSKTGNPIAQAGDLFAEKPVAKHKTFTDTVDIYINQIKQ